MFSRLHNRLGTAGLVVAVVALVAALAGTAFAATKLNGTQKKEVEKIAKKFAGKNGAPGANGKEGAPGANGKDGTNGTNGAGGAGGKSVVAGTEGTGTGNCEGRGGATVEVEGEPATKKYACNGKDGTTGFTETLPSGKTETGAWGDFSTAAGLSGSPISFPIPLASAPEFALVKQGKIGIENAAKCPGYVGGKPTAIEGVLCIYVSNEVGGAVSNFFDPSAEEAAAVSPSGVVLLLELDGEGPLFGTWAVTAE